jgi:prevent-host-death family protein
MHEWQLQDAKNRFSELVRRAQKEGPQTVTLHGKPAAVVHPADAYATLTTPRLSLTEYLLPGPPWPDDMVEFDQRSRTRHRP